MEMSSRNCEQRMSPLFDFYSHKKSSEFDNLKNRYYYQILCFLIPCVCCAVTFQLKLLFNSMANQTDLIELPDAHPIAPPSRIVSIHKCGYTYFT